jgi:hypothetical protein
VRLVTLGERPDLLPGLRRIVKSVWPPTMEYVHHDAVCDRHWPALVEQFADFQPVLCDRGERVVAGGYTIPFVWDGRRATLPSGVDGVLVRGVRDRRHGRAPTALSALLAVVDPKLQGRGLAARSSGAWPCSRRGTDCAPWWPPCAPPTSIGIR